MGGWRLSLYRPADGGGAPASTDSAREVRLAEWRADDLGLRWIDDLVKEGKAVDLGGMGYPTRFTAPAALLRPILAKAPPAARRMRVAGHGDVLTSWGVGPNTIHGESMAACRPDEWLLLEAWDES
jgi:hypothetical protein